jgi:hypothetical protein
VLCGAYARGWRHRGNAEEVEARSALLGLTRLGWGRNNPAFRQLFTRRFIPDAGTAEMEWFNDLQRVSTSPETAHRLMDSFSRVDVRRLLVEVKAPTLVFHAQHDGVVPFDEGRLLAAGIPGSTFVPLPSRIICCSSTSRRGASSCASLARFSAGATRPDNIRPRRRRVDGVRGLSRHYPSRVGRLDSQYISGAF